MSKIRKIAPNPYINLFIIVEMFMSRSIQGSRQLLSSAFVFVALSMLALAGCGSDEKKSDASAEEASAMDAVKQRAGEAMEMAGDKLSEAKSKTGEAMQDASDAVSEAAQEAKSKTGEAVQDASDAISGAAEEAKAITGEAVQAASDAVSEGAEGIKSASKEGAAKAEALMEDAQLKVEEGVEKTKEAVKE